MKVLLSAIACHPQLGSEAKVGWDAARAIARLPDVEECHVMTHGSSREAIIQQAGEVNQIRFHFYDRPFRFHPNRLLARLQSWLLYRDWQRNSVIRAAALHREHGFSLAHHVTYASWRIPPELWRMPIPFVFGPVGGGTITPPAFRSMLGASSQAFEVLRGAATAIATRSPSLKLCCAESSAVVAADAATAAFLCQHGASRVHRLCQVFFSEEETARLKNCRQKEPHDATRLAIFAGGNLEGRKGTALSLQALAILQRKGIPFTYNYGGWGPDLKTMTKLARDLDIGQHVNFHEGYSGQEYLRQMAASDVFLLPSIRETAGITMMEAMMAGCYPIVLAGTGGGDIVELAGGAAIKAKAPEEAVQRIARQLEWCFTNRRQMRQDAETAGINVSKLYSEQAYQKAIVDIYTEAIERHRERSIKA